MNDSSSPVAGAADDLPERRYWIAETPPIPDRLWWIWRCDLHGTLWPIAGYQTRREAEALAHEFNAL